MRGSPAGYLSGCIGISMATSTFEDLTPRSCPSTARCVSAGKVRNPGRDVASPWCRAIRPIGISTAVAGLECDDSIRRHDRHAIGAAVDSDDLAIDDDGAWGGAGERFD